ncbi:MAG: DUF4190 domain-containing protein [Actinomycetota bacterium]|nr:DUF4190 domain-containing protein [Actinomycetota bacterium]
MPTSRQQTPIPPPPPPSPGPANLWQANWSFYLGIINLLVYLDGGWGYLLFTAPAAFVLGILARKRIKDQPERFKGSGKALAGMILGALQLVAFVVLVGKELNDLPW